MLDTLLRRSDANWSGVLLSITCLMVLGTAGVAGAHVVLHPHEAPADSYQKFDVSVPTEKDSPTTKVQVEVPEGFTVTGVQPVSGWQAEFQKDEGVVKSITWSGGKIAPEEFQAFAVQARIPEETGEYAWKAFQTYQDGSVVQWTGPPGEEGAGNNDEEESEDSGPPSVVEVVQSGAQPNMPGAAAPESGGGFTPIAAYSGLGLGALALVVALLALLRQRKTS